MDYLNRLGAERNRIGEAYGLHYGDAATALVRILPDEQWAGMFRMHWPDGSISDMANLTRARDAAAAICERGPPVRNSRRFHWKIERSKTALEAPPIAPNHLDGLRERSEVLA
jgi:hypothetical protein